MGEEDDGYFADLDPNSPAMNAETLGGTPDINNVAQTLINTGPITPAQAARAGEDLAQIPGRGNVNPADYYVPVPDFYTDGQLADRGSEPGNTITLVRGGENPQQPAGTPVNISPEQQAAIDNWLANNPPGTVINIPGGGSVTVPGYTGPTRTVNPNDLMLQNLQIQQGQGGRGSSVATQFGLRGISPTQPVGRGNPFRRPGDEGIASLVPSGG